MILKRAPKWDGLRVVGCHGLDALDRSMRGVVLMKPIPHATCPALVIKGEAALLRRIALGPMGLPHRPKDFVLSSFGGSSDRQGRAGADSCECDPCNDAQLVGPHHDQIDDPVDQVLRS